jgi:hypothetical protein
MLWVPFMTVVANLSQRQCLIHLNISAKSIIAVEKSDASSDTDKQNYGFVLVIFGKNAMNPNNREMADLICRLLRQYQFG